MFKIEVRLHFHLSARRPLRRRPLLRRLHRPENFPAGCWSPLRQIEWRPPPSPARSRFSSFSPAGIGATAARGVRPNLERSKFLIKRRIREGDTFWSAITCSFKNGTQCAPPYNGTNKEPVLFWAPSNIAPCFSRSCYNMYFCRRYRNTPGGNVRD